MTDEKLSDSVTEFVPVLSVHSGYKVQSGLVQIQFNLFTLPNALEYLLFKTRNVMKPPFPMTRHPMGEGDARVIVRNTCVNCSINFHHGIYKMFVRTDNADRDQTAQTVQPDVRYTQYDNCGDLFFS